MNNPFLNPLGALLNEFYALADWRQDESEFAREHCLDLELVNAHAGGFFLLPCRFDDAGFFDFAEDGDTAAVFEVLDEDAAATIDLCAFSVADPTRFGTAMGSAAVLGETNVTNPASWAFGNVLPIHQRPLDWLRSGCRGVVILDHRRAPVIMSKALGPILATDEDHARVLRDMLCTPPVDPRNIVFRRSPDRRAAA
jgi:hypothetical protein